MIRTQVQLTEEQAEALKDLASRTGVSVAELVRRGVDQLLSASPEVDAEERARRAIAAAGKYSSGHHDVSTRHDQHLGEAFRG